MSDVTIAQKEARLTAKCEVWPALSKVGIVARVLCISPNEPRDAPYIVLTVGKRANGN